MKQTILILALACGLTHTALADYDTALKALSHAKQKWDKDPDKCHKLLVEALEHTDPKAKEEKHRVLRMNVRHTLGRFYQGKRADFAEAKKQYQMMLRENGSSLPKTPTILALKAKALMQLGVIYYTHDKNVGEAVTSFNDSYKTYSTPEAADRLSKLLLRQSRNPGLRPSLGKKKLRLAEKVSREAIRVDKKDLTKSSSKAIRADYRLQLAMVLLARGKKVDAEQEFKAIKTEDFGNDSLYARALWTAMNDGDEAAVRAFLEKALDKELRPEPEARNQMRWFIRTEPDFKKFLETPAWEKLLKDEGVRKPKK